jgi:hypothetical protein
LREVPSRGCTVSVGRLAVTHAPCDFEAQSEPFAWLLRGCVCRLFRPG